MNETITIGSCFAGIGGFELGLERGIPNSKTIWQIEQNKYCQSILQKHWPDATIYDDIKELDYATIESVDIVCGGFPCQDISAAGKGKGIEHGDRSGLWRQMHRLINHLQPRVAVLENVPALLWKNRGMHIVLQDLASIGYDAEWCTISARQFGAPHLRKRVFIIAYPNSSQPRQNEPVQTRGLSLDASYQYNDTKSKITYPMQIRCRQNGKQHSNQIDRNRSTIRKRRQEEKSRQDNFTNSNSKHSQTKSINAINLEAQSRFERRSSQDNGIQPKDNSNYWQNFPTQPALRHRDDGLSDRLARLRALGNAIVPQCSQYIGKKIYESNLLNYKN